LLIKRPTRHVGSLEPIILFVIHWLNRLFLRNSLLWLFNQIIFDHLLGNGNPFVIISLDILYRDSEFLVGYINFGGPEYFKLSSLDLMGLYLQFDG